MLRKATLFPCKWVRILPGSSRSHVQLAILQSVPLHVTGSCLSRGSKEDKSVNL